MELSSDQIWYFLLELRRDLTKLQIRLLEPQDAPLDTVHELAKLRQELHQTTCALEDIARTMQRPSV
jgi:hypothetical protein